MTRCANGSVFERSAALSPSRAEPLTEPRYKVAMHHDTIRFHGVYRYPSADVLARALASARAWLDEEELYDLEGDWLANFVTAGATLKVDTLLPLEADRYAAVAVLEALAQDAIEGVVEARRGDTRIDSFPSGPEE